MFSQLNIPFDGMYIVIIFKRITYSTMQIKSLLFINLCLEFGKAPSSFTTVLLV